MERLSVEDSAFAEANIPSRRQLALLTFGVEGGMLVLAVGLSLFADPPIWATLVFDFTALLSGSLFGLLTLAVVFAVVETPWGRKTRLAQDVDQLVVMFREARPIDLIWISLLAGLGEEALFRGVLMHFGSLWLGVPVGLLLSSLLFGLVHAISLAYVIFAALLGLAMGGLYLWSGNLVVPIVAHAVYDLAALAYILYLRPVSTRTAP